MPRGDRGKRLAAIDWAFPLIGLLIALGIAFGLGVLTGSSDTNPPSHEQHKRDTPAQRRYAQSITGTLGNADPHYSAYPNANSGNCYYAQDHDSADLCAQWRAAVAAEEAAKWTKGGFWLSLCGGILSAIGLLCLLLSLRQTERSLRAARKANRIAIRTSRQELRAYLSIDSVGFHFKAANGKKSNFSAIFKNSGQTPAKVWGVIRNHFEDDQWTPPLMSDDEVRGYIPQMVGPGATVGAFHRPVKMSDADEIGYAENKKWFFISTAHIYEDVFGRTYRIDALYRSRGIGHGAAVDPRYHREHQIESIVEN